MRAKYDHSQPLEVIFQQIVTAAEFSEAEEKSYDPKQMASRVYLLVLKTELYPEVYIDWKNRNESANIWSAFKLYFTKEHSDLRLIQTVAENIGYRARLNVYENRTPRDNNMNNHDNEEVLAEMKDIITALANDTTDGGNTMASTLQELTTTLKVLQNEIDNFY